MIIDAFLRTMQINIAWLVKLENPNERIFFKMEEDEPFSLLLALNSNQD